ncbi:MAG: hypothetical protein HWE27_12035 [Gammaproteobacteria bacterium]|nr:hypothetical protein [Gammaproteobacteria bacterium]
MARYVLIIFLVLIISGCSNPLPEERLEYVGQWHSKEMGLVILRDGTVSYKRIKNGGTVSVNGPLQEFIGDDFTVGILFMTTRFQVTKPPRKIDGVWKMTVDGVELTKS